MSFSQSPSTLVAAWSLFATVYAGLAEQQAAGGCPVSTFYYAMGVSAGNQLSANHLWLPMVLRMRSSDLLSKDLLHRAVS